jgi:hypothetical protein
MASSLEDILSALTPEQCARVEAHAQERIEEEMTLRDLRQTRHPTRERMAELLGVDQESVSRIKRHADLLLSTLASDKSSLQALLAILVHFGMPSRALVEKDYCLSCEPITAGEKRCGRSCRSRQLSDVKAAATV